MDNNKKIENNSINNNTEGEIYDSGFYVSVRFPNSRPYYFHTYDDSLEIDTKVVVETIRGVELGTIISPIKEIASLKSETPLKPILRRASLQDLEQAEENIELAKSAYVVCENAIEKLGLEMKLLHAEYTLDRNKVIFLYVADNRVDFRELLKDLAAALRCRIELRQIGSRDRSRLIGGLGPCGLPLCCNTFLGEFDGISINMAKNQFLALNIQKLSGHCGKLICCLKYEDDQYSELRKGLPKIGFKIKYEDEIYKITSINVLTGDVRLENAESSQSVSLDEVLKIIDKTRGNNDE